MEKKICNMNFFKRLRGKYKGEIEFYHEYMKKICFFVYSQENELSSKTELLTKAYTELSSKKFQGFWSTELSSINNYSEMSIC